MSIRILMSDTSDGSMKSVGGDHLRTQDVRGRFLEANEVSLEDTTLLQVAYEGDDYCRYTTLSSGSLGDGIVRTPTIVSDALLTHQPGHALFLPLADCAPMVIYDESSTTVMLSHLGRHSIEQEGAKKSVEYYLGQTGVSPASLRIWVGPAAGAENYPIWSLDNKGLHEVILEQLAEAGIASDRIELVDIDTTTAPNLYSHSNYLKGLQDDIGDGRFAVVAVLDI